MLREDFVRARGISAYRLAQDLQISQTRILEILKGRRRITADTALRLSYYFGTTPQFLAGFAE